MIYMIPKLNLDVGEMRLTFCDLHVSLSWDINSMNLSWFCQATHPILGILLIKIVFLL